MTSSHPALGVDCHFRCQLVVSELSRTCAYVCVRVDFDRVSVSKSSIDLLYVHKIYDFICVRRLRLLGVYPGLLWDRALRSYRTAPQIGGGCQSRCPGVSPGGQSEGLQCPARWGNKNKLDASSNLALTPQSLILYICKYNGAPYYIVYTISIYRARVTVHTRTCHACSIHMFWCPAF